MSHARHRPLAEPLHVGEGPGGFNMKYIRHKKLGFVLFEGSVQHAEVARSLGSTDDIVSAGFVFAPHVAFKCLGHSSSLNLSVAPADESDLRARMVGF